MAVREQCFHVSRAAVWTEVMIFLCARGGDGMRTGTDVLCTSHARDRLRFRQGKGRKGFQAASARLYLRARTFQVPRRAFFRFNYSHGTGPCSRHVHTSCGMHHVALRMLHQAHHGSVRRVCSVRGREQTIFFSGNGNTHTFTWVGTCHLRKIYPLPSRWNVAIPCAPYACNAWKNRRMTEWPGGRVACIDSMSAA